MKKKSIVLLILFTLILVISNVSFATGLNNNQVSNTTTNTTTNTATNTVTNTIANTTNNEVINQVAENVLGEVEDLNTNNEVMPISIDMENEENYIAMDFVESDVYLFDSQISYDSSVNGNVYAMGKTVNINSSLISGNLFVMAEEAIIDADVSGSLYVFANRVTIKSGANDAYIAGNKVILEENAYIYRDAKIASDTLDMKGYIYRNLYSVSETTNIANNGIAGVEGTIYYDGELNASQVENVVKLETPIKETENSDITDTILTVITKAVTAIVIIGLLTIITKNKETNNENRNYIVDVLIGIGLIVLVPAIMFICMFTIVGIPVAMILLIVYILMLFFSVYAAALDIAKIVMNGSSNLIKFVVAVIIYIAFEFIGMIPVGGGIIKFLIISYGFKVIIREIFPKKQIKEKTEQEIISE